jgi:hypothetical protein
MIKWSSSLLIIALIALAGTAGLHTTVYACKYTGDLLKVSTFWGIETNSSRSEGYARWLKDEFGITLAPDYVHFLDFHPWRPAASTPPGNWPWLRSAKRIYDEHPSLRQHVARLLQQLAAKNPPLIEEAEGEALDALLRKADEPVSNGD